MPEPRAAIYEGYFAVSGGYRVCILTKREHYGPKTCYTDCAFEVSVAPSRKCQNICEITRQMLPSTSYRSNVVVIVTLLNSVQFLLWEAYLKEQLKK